MPRVLIFLLVLTFLPGAPGATGRRFIQHETSLGWAAADPTKLSSRGPSVAPRADRKQEDPSCSEHGGVAELDWAGLLEPSQIDGRFWCWGGSHYVVVERQLLSMALWILDQIADPVRA